MTPRRQRVALLAAAVLWCGLARAELVVIYDSGATRPLAPLFEVFDELPADAPARPPAPALGAADAARLLPIRTPGLRPGPVVPHPVRLPPGASLPRPFFLVGSDPDSRAWLARERKRLRALGAVGMLVQAETPADLATMAELAGGLPLLPAPADDLVRTLGLRHLPVLVTRDGLAQ